MQSTGILATGLISVLVFALSLTTMAATYDETIHKTQKRLQALGYEPGPPDGLLGEKTKAAVKKFQQDKGLPITGKIDQATLAALHTKATLEATPPTLPLKPTPQAIVKEELVARTEATQEEAALQTRLTKAKEAEEAGITAEQQGRLREALKQYMTALEPLIENDPRLTEIDQRVRERLLEVVQRLDVPPEVPEEARRKTRCALAALGDLDAAIIELQDALRLAPWWGEAYLYLAWMMEKRENYSDAARSLSLYLRVTPNADNADAVKRRIIWLEDEARRPQGWLGLAVQRLTPELAQAFRLKDNVGVLIADVEPKSPASKAGLRRGDIILEFEGKKAEDIDEFMRTLPLTSPGKAVSVKIWRDGRAQELVATMAELPRIRRQQPVLRSAVIARCVNTKSLAP